MMLSVTRAITVMTVTIAVTVTILIAAPPAFIHAAVHHERRGAFPGEFQHAETFADSVDVVSPVTEHDQPEIGETRDPLRIGHEKERRSIDDDQVILSARITHHLLEYVPSQKLRRVGGNRTGAKKRHIRGSIHRTEHILDFGMPVKHIRKALSTTGNYWSLGQS